MHIPNPDYIIYELGLVWFGWVGFYGTSTIVGYLMTNTLYAYILNIYTIL